MLSSSSLLVAVVMAVGNLSGTARMSLIGGSSWEKVEWSRYWKSVHMYVNVSVWILRVPQACFYSVVCVCVMRCVLLRAAACCCRCVCVTCCGSRRRWAWRCHQRPERSPLSGRLGETEKNEWLPPVCECVYFLKQHLHVLCCWIFRSRTSGAPCSSASRADSVAMSSSSVLRTRNACRHQRVWFWVWDHVMYNKKLPSILEAHSVHSCMTHSASVSTSLRTLSHVGVSHI